MTEMMVAGHGRFGRHRYRRERNTAIGNLHRHECLLQRAALDPQILRHKEKQEVVVAFITDHRTKRWMGT